MNKNIIKLILEAAGRGLTIFDIDETLFHTKAYVQVKKNGKIIKQLDNIAYSQYKLKKGEELDFGQFKNSKIFNTTSTPMANMINKAKVILKNATKAGSKVIFVTARADMDDKKLFIDTFKAQGIDMSKVYVERAGNFGIETGKIKSIVFRKYLDSKKYRRIRLYDDSMENLLALLSLRDDYPNITFEAYKVTKKGTIKTIR
jgi:predicted secreted acid phosphatase